MFVAFVEALRRCSAALRTNYRRRFGAGGLMKFTDGYWRLRPGVQPLYPVHVHDVETGADRLTVYAPTKRVNGRGDTLDTPLITVRCTAPAPDVIAVRISR